ncbi:MAG: NADH-quinone oxidoreductase subunit NuoE [Spirochaetes bacterium]|nr:NADH-quinone oxidoreductase subunit NuoE [Spirochaetota bacterium]
MERKFNELLKEWSGEQGNVIPLLQKTQEIFSYLPEDAMAEIGRVTGKSSAEIYGVATFYAQFRFEPMGKHIIKVCHGTACHVSSADLLDQTIENELAAVPGKTTEDGLFTIERVACLGCCSLAPVVMIDGEVYGKLTGDKLKKILKKTKGNK